MIADGLVEEVRALLERGYHAELNPMKSLGYKEIAEFLAGEYDLPTAIEYIKRNTRRYAKRQLTWFRKYEAVNWIFRKPDAPVEPVVEQCLQMIPHQWMIR
jgi:tRNA dimethylallyltransferase